MPHRVHKVVRKTTRPKRHATPAQLRALAHARAVKAAKHHR